MTARRVMKKEPMAALFVGGLVGAGVALLAAPGSGREMRQRIGRLTGDAKEKVRDYAAAGRVKVINIAERGRKYVRGRKTMVTAAVAAGRQAYVEEKGKLAGKG